VLSNRRGIRKNLSGIDDLLGFDGETLGFLDLGLDVCDLNATGDGSAQVPDMKDDSLTVSVSSASTWNICR
jgi:hypothetical protein